MKKLLSILLLLSLLTALSACAPKIPNGYDESTLTSSAQSVVRLVNSGDYEAVISMLREDMQSEVTVEDLSLAYDEPIAKAGAFVNFKVPDFSVTNDRTTGETYCVVELKCEYENKTYNFNVTFNRSMEVVGLFMK